MLTQLKAGAIDIFSNVGFAQLDQAKAASGMQVLFTANMIWEHMDFNLDKPFISGLKNPAGDHFWPGPAKFSGHNDERSRGSFCRGPASRIRRYIIPGCSLLSVMWGWQRLLTEAGWKPGNDGIMVKDGKRHFYYCFHSGQ